MPPVLDRTIAVLLLPIVLPILAALFLIALCVQGRPFIYCSERMRSPSRSFSLMKIRTMEPVDEAEAEAVLGGDQAWRVTRLGQVLRRTRLDELPQIFNIIRGDMRFVGPRPPLRRYVQSYPDLYDRVLSIPPGITGLATVMTYRREERLLSRCRTREDTDRIYREHCVPLKARLDLLYLQRRSIGLDLFILWRTVSRIAGQSRAEVKLQGRRRLFRAASAPRQATAQ